MKTWTNPTVEELEVKLTAQGDYPSLIEKLPWLPDYDLIGRPSNGDGNDPIPDDEGKEEGTPS